MTSLFEPRFPVAHTGFIGSPIERDDRIQRSPETLWAARMHPGARWMVLDGLNPLLAEDGPNIAWLRRSEVPEASVEVYLGLEDGSPRFAVGASAAGLPGAPVDARRAAMLMDDGRAAIIAQARSLLRQLRRAD
ncbi:MAG: hypothetical protein H3C62_13550 [Gemmatimonadaceae bacterium]|nr:hypothetical protein [Gemmatimonadaceae bacterium]